MSEESHSAGDSSRALPLERGRALVSGGSGRALALVLLIALAARALLIGSLAPVFFHGEELEKGAAAVALLEGLDLPYVQKAYHLYEGGGFVISHLEALAFTLFGQSVLAVKLVALGWSLLVLTAGWLLVRRHAGTRAATLFALLLVFAPRPFQLLALLALGIHFEACLFLALVLDRGLLLLRERRPVDGLWLGLFSGLGIYFSYQLVPVVGYVGLVLLLRTPRTVLGRPGALGVLGLLVGLAPFGLAYAGVGSALFDIHGSDLTGGARPDTLELLGQFASSTLLEGSLLSRGLHALWMLLLLSAAPLGLFLHKDLRCRGTSAFLGGFLLVWLAAYLGSGFAVGRVYFHFQWMRLAPAFFVALAALAILLSSRQRLAGAVVLLGVATWGQLLAEARPLALADNLATLASTRGVDWQGYLVKVLPRVGVEVPVIQKLGELDAEPRELLRTDLARAAWRSRPEPASVEVLREALLGPGSGQEEAAEVARGLGAWAWRTGPGGRAGALAFAADLGEPWGSAVQHGAGFRGDSGTYTREAIEAELAGLPADPDLQPYLRGIGERIHRRLVVGPYGPELALRPELARSWIAGLREDQRGALLEGFERSVEAYRLP